MLFSCRLSSSSYHLAGWNDKCRKQKDDANFWSKVWEEAGCPRSGALFNLKRFTKRKYKSSVHRLQCRKQYLLLDKMAKLYASKRMDSLWSKVKQLNRSSTSHASVVDEISNIASMFASNLHSLLNLHSPEHHFTPSLMMLFISIMFNFPSLTMWYILDICCHLP